MSVGVKLNHKKAVSLITMLRNKRMIVQENGRKYTFKMCIRDSPSTLCLAPMQEEEHSSAMRWLSESLHKWL